MVQINLKLPTAPMLHEGDPIAGTDWYGPYPPDAETGIFHEHVYTDFSGLNSESTADELATKTKKMEQKNIVCEEPPIR